MLEPSWYVDIDHKRPQNNHNQGEISHIESYHIRLISALGRVSKFNGRITVEYGRFVCHSNTSDLIIHSYPIAPKFDPDSDTMLKMLEAQLDEHEQKTTKKKRAELIANAMNKLTTEEQNALGL